MYLLAQLKEQRAFPLIIKICELPPFVCEYLLGDVLTESLYALLASTFNGNLQELNRIATNQYLNEYARGAAIGAHLILYKHEIISRKQLIQIMKNWFADFVHDYSYIPSKLIDCCNHIHATELTQEIETYFDLDLADPFCASKNDLQKHFALPRAEALRQFHEHWGFNYIDVCQSSIGWLFRNDENEEFCDESDDEEYFDDCDGECYPGCTENCKESLSSSTNKVGRNNPCPCGSGKKYKKCCADVLPF